MADENKRWDLKQVGSGAGASALILFLMQNQGVELMNRNQDSQSQVVIEKTMANAERINRLEQNVIQLNNKIDDGFKGLREQLAVQIEKIIELTSRSQDRYTKTEHLSYASAIDARMKLIEDDNKEIKKLIYELRYNLKERKQ